MEKVLILNGSPRAPKSNSKRYAEIFMRYSSNEVTYQNITRKNHLELCATLDGYSDLLLVFPLYADALPVGVLEFLKVLEANPPQHRPVISILINCGFLEYKQNKVAMQMMELFCRRNGYRLGAQLMLGSGEAILDTPFRFIAVRNIRKLARSIERGTYRTFCATMPLPKKIFQWAANRYWTIYGKRLGITKEQMQTMKIESQNS